MVAFAHNYRPANRVCLKCDKKFDSQGPGNRICRKCHKLNARYAGNCEAWLQSQRGVKRHNGEVILCGC
ncbi:hypothetical protein Q31b_15280 [Novipirellula aureliae]|uniref:Uncharacterized protein n=1 Tax=Novipirellula aureliae TaxID=2527966 RepID=A0A5C6E603_9BACT|nr:hypothetical protein Q31b_15280 [Novipirellula aureliae]